MSSIFSFFFRFFRLFLLRLFALLLNHLFRSTTKNTRILDTSYSCFFLFPMHFFTHLLILSLPNFCISQYSMIIPGVYQEKLVGERENDFDGLLCCFNFLFHTAIVFL